MPAPAVVSADLAVPTAETRKRRASYPARRCACLLIVVGRIEIGRLDGGGHQHGHACPPNQGKLLHCRPPDESLPPEASGQAKIHFMVRPRDHASCDLPHNRRNSTSTYLPKLRSVTALPNRQPLALLFRTQRAFFTHPTLAAVPTHPASDTHRGHQFRLRPPGPRPGQFELTLERLARQFLPFGLLFGGEQREDFLLGDVAQFHGFLRAWSKSAPPWNKPRIDSPVSRAMVSIFSFCSSVNCRADHDLRVTKSPGFVLAS